MIIYTWHTVLHTYNTYTYSPDTQVVYQKLILDIMRGALMQQSDLWSRWSLSSLSSWFTRLSFLTRWTLQPEGNRIISWDHRMRREEEKIYQLTCGPGGPVIPYKKGKGVIEMSHKVSNILQVCVCAYWENIWTVFSNSISII